MYLSTKVVVAIAFATIVVALDESRNAQLTHYEYENSPTGDYHFGFKSSDGIERQEEGTLVHAGSDHAAVIVKGSYSYVGPDGVEYTVRYTADENGFHPEGDHFSVPPYVPWPIHADVNDVPLDVPYKTGENIKGAYQDENSSPIPSAPYNYNRPTTGKPFNIPEVVITTPKPYPNFNNPTSQLYLPSTQSPKVIKRENSDDNKSSESQKIAKDINDIFAKLKKE